MRLRIVRILVCLALASAGWAQTADELVVRNIEARGGAQKLHAIQTMLMTGTISFGDSSSPITVQVKRPNLIREQFKVRQVDIVRAFDGTVGWQSEKGDTGAAKVEELKAGDLDNIKEEAENAIEGPLLDYTKKGSKAEFLGKDTFDGKPVYKLKITTHMGTTITQFLDTTTYLEIHEEIERSANGKVILIVEDVGEDGEVDGVKFAHLFVSGPKDNPKASKLQIDKMQLNAPLDAGVFAMPQSEKSEVRMQK